MWNVQGILLKNLLKEHISFTPAEDINVVSTT